MAAFDGRIDTLFVAIGVEQWGMFDSNSRTVEVHQEAMNGDEDLLDVAATYTLLRSGTVHTVAPEQMPEHIPAAASASAYPVIPEPPRASIPSSRFQSS
jgi:hypothetical protein